MSSPGVRVAGDLPCVQCGYELRTLSLAGQCPECGTPIGLSHQFELQPFADKIWGRRVFHGVLFIMAAIIWAASYALLEQEWWSLVPIIWALARVPMVLLLLGAWMVTTSPKAVSHAWRSMRLHGWFLRGACLLLIVLKVFASGMDLWPVLPWGITPIPYAELALASAVATLFFIYLARIANRLLSRILARCLAGIGVSVICLRGAELLLPHFLFSVLGASEGPAYIVYYALRGCELVSMVIIGSGLAATICLQWRLQRVLREQRRATLTPDDSSIGAAP